MNVHLVKSPELSTEVYSDIVSVLKQFDGQFLFIEHNDAAKETPSRNKIWESEADFITKSCLFEDLEYSQMPEEEAVSDWEDLFNTCRAFRIIYDIGDSEYVVLLTDISNNQNWFSGGDVEEKNIFVHTANWEYFMGEAIDIRFPISYQIAAVLLRHSMFNNYTEIIEHVHMEPRGCLMDFCENKKEIILKMRTGDICPECMSHIEETGVSRNLVRDVFNILDRIRKNMTFRNRSAFLNKPSRIEIRGHMKRIYFTDLGDLELRLNPKEKSIYLFFLNHPEGIMLSALQDYREEIGGYYRELCNIDLMEVIEAAIDLLLNPLDNNINVILSRIKLKLKNAVGDDLLHQYIISGEHGNEKRIKLDRELVKSIE